MFTTSKKLLIAATVLSPLALMSIGATSALAQSYGPARPDQGYMPAGSWQPGTTSASGGGWGVPYIGDDGCTYQDFIEFDDNGQPHVTQHVQTYCPPPPPPVVELTPGEADSALRTILGVPSAETERQVPDFDRSAKKDLATGGGEPSDKVSIGNTGHSERTSTTRSNETRTADTRETTERSTARAPHGTATRVSQERGNGFPVARKDGHFRPTAMRTTGLGGMRTGGFGGMRLAGLGGMRMGGLGGMRMGGLGGMRMGGLGGMHMGGFGRH